MTAKTKDSRVEKEKPGEERFIATGKGVQLISKKKKSVKPKGAK